jgi:hypothetical protein
MLSFRNLLVLLLAVPALSHAIDLRSLFHPDPPVPPKAPPPKELARVSFANDAARDPQVETFMRALAEAIKAREGKPMLARLSDRYAIDALPEGSKAPDLFVQAVERIPGPIEIVIQGVDRAGEVRSARTEFRYAAAPAKARTFRFDAAGRLVWSDLFVLRVERNGS